MCIVCCLLGYGSSDIDFSFCLGSKYGTGSGLVRDFMKRNMAALAELVFFISSLSFAK